MQTSVISGRVPTTLKTRVDKKLRKRGWVAGDVIEGAYRYIDEHDDAPWMEEAAIDRDGEALRELDGLLAAIPAGTRLDTMSAAEMRGELANRG